MRSLPVTNPPRGPTGLGQVMMMMAISLVGDGMVSLTAAKPA